MDFNAVLEFLEDDTSPAMEFDLLAGGDPGMNSDAEGNPREDTGGNTPQTPQEPQQQQNPMQNQDPNQNDDMGGMDDDMGDMGGGEDDFGGEDDMGGDEMGDDMGDGGEDMEDVDTNSTTDSDPDTERKINLRKLILALINAYKSSIEAMTKITPPAEDGLASKYYNLQEKMESAKEILYEIATNDVYTKPYEDTLRRYSALNQLYSICIEYLNTILIKKPEDVKKKKASRSKPTVFRNNVKVIR